MSSMKLDTGRPPSGAAPTSPRPAAAGVATVRSAELLGGARQLHIEHGGEIYILRQTSKGKLILTK